MKNIKLLIEYDGTNYSGWQKQKMENIKTIQGTIENSISNIIEENTEIIGCSRTDAGVHAKGFVANFKTNSRIPSEKFKYAINNLLPEDIVILDSKEVDLDFHSRYSCIGKRYIYKILNRENASPILRNYSYHIKKSLDIDRMYKASKYFIGRHDFSAFKSSGSNVQSSIRTIIDTEIYRKDDLLIFAVSGDGFLYNMVRIIVGTLIEVGIGKRESDDIVAILESKDRKKAGPCVPPMGLYLDKVFY
ncbi:tRNA pseudouridine38-40 synthase [Clostridium tetanomorphum]|uniref:tRNA pseudouridine synthase A n=1 Tax=Clostridium tetanomorphum TaxID=1553 RepID=A0A923EA95_CLOTT|nr:tRNA pseudouridine(38-40) synthase TruA [Clostridium tetanomorphum]KAJ52258.1 tRNA pseudouridine synthase A [Clostridium tetanomorphum DSM 665]MBC2397591.1 tRNA pseudouridine(38-40) synthase TruA [Clostridium tetanomorphum]MBP1863737.1 tRNA pseudouridine38-40 synthase [Clostridium tetanomorphum]NRS86313.1 tRNA pseudouridine38-40 synthase [Clostridium tetanomorphum]NRZ95657.1 tRNA pseudouridine38-40 synthase [Clostridium tetanomorphum]